MFFDCKKNHQNIQTVKKIDRKSSSLCMCIISIMQLTNIIFASFCLLSLCSTKSFCIDLKIKKISDYDIDELDMNRNDSFNRRPANFVADEDIEIVKINDGKTVNDYFNDDDSGVLSNMRKKINTWDNNKEFVETWSLKNNSFYNSPSDDDKKQYVVNNTLKYLDKFLSGEMKNAEKGSKLSKISRVHSALKPSSKLSVSDNIRLKVSARVLQGYMNVKLDNPYIDTNLTMKATGQATFEMSKNFAPIGFKTGVNYLIDQNLWVASVNQKITTHISATILSEQPMGTIPSDEKAVQRMSLDYVLNF